jgi:tetratricopeptide (TPR) repeat protein
MGDCYFMLGNTAMMKLRYGRAAQLMSASLVTNSKDGLGWANLAFYHAKLGDRVNAETDLKNARSLAAKDDVGLQFMIVQALDVLGRKKEALDLLVFCIGKGLSEADVDLAVDLKDLRSTPDYQQALKNRKASAS